jgi:DNA helicase IV
LPSEEISREQEYVTMLYGRLDQLRGQAASRLAEVLRRSGGTQQGRTERDASAAMYGEQVARLNAVENGLCFGRLDFIDGQRRYIGRLGIFDESADYEPLLVDWRAPAARHFYLATAASPDGVRRRRHIRTVDRKVVHVEDDLLDLAAGAADGDGLTGEAVLLAALNASRTGRMSDIVETIQAEQDRVIRADLRGILVVQGGPGTGKTAVALHRAAYLLYTHRRELAKRGVLVIGPNATYLRYISDVLPTLGETGVLLSTVADLYPGIRARRPESATVAEIKGRSAMADVVANAVRDRQTVPERVRAIDAAGDVLLLYRATAEDARALARRSRRPHNLARPVFADAVLDALARQLADRIGEDPFADDPLGGDDAPGAGANLLGAADVAEIRRDLAGDPAVHAALDEFWPVLTPEQLLAGLYSSAGRLARAAPDLTAAERALLRRDDDPHAWSAADVPLLDEAAELLGEDDRADRARAERAHRARLATAQGVLDILAGSAAHELDDEPEILTAYDLLDPAKLAARQEFEDGLTVVERAAADRRWAYGHVVVDEAQELSEMAWRMLMRRCPSRSMTIVGDLAQTGELAVTSSWERALTPYADGRWRMEQLTVNYRVPAEIMDIATDVLASLDPSLDPPRSVRRTGVPARRRQVPADRLRQRLRTFVTREAASIGDGRLAVLAPAGRLEELRRALGVTADQDLSNPVVVIDVKRAKGLEFDRVVVVEPAQLVAESPRGLNDLYVALTRATQRLTVVHSAPLPAAMGRLAAA